MAAFRPRTCSRNAAAASPECKPLDLGLTYITVQSSNKEAPQVFDSEKGLESTPDTKLLKGRESEFDVGFGVADPKDIVMELALQDDFERPSLLYTT